MPAFKRLIILLVTNPAPLLTAPLCPESSGALSLDNSRKLADGNHDCLKIAPALEDARISMLINDSVTFGRNNPPWSIADGDTIGYTSFGAGSSGVPIRFNCPPEVVLLTLTRAARGAWG
jgi:hypothetical protein